MPLVRSESGVRTWEDLVEAIEPALAVHLQDETLYFEPAFPSLGPGRSRA
jgi:hypothetical protein